MFLKNIQSSNTHDKIFKFVCYFILFQPIFDLLSFLYIRNYIPIGISTYAKPLIAGIIMIVLLFVYKKYILKSFTLFGVFGAWLIVHTYLLINLNTKISVILHEIRFMLNLVYILITFVNLFILYSESQDKEKFSSTLKNTLLYTFGLYIFMYFLSIATGTSAKTYEYSDPLKQGYKGWLDSGQIFGHSLCILLPLIIHLLLNNKLKNKFANLLVRFAVVLPTAVLCLIGTKVTFYIALLVLFASFVLNLFFCFKDKDLKKLYSSIISVICIVAVILAYPILPVKTNIDINESVLSAPSNEELIEDITNAENENHEPIDPNDMDDASELIKYLKWEKKAYAKLYKLHSEGSIHTADTRNQQLFFNFEKYRLSDFKYKLFGIGYLNQPSNLSVERDIFATLFNFGAMGFLIFLLYPIILWCKSTFIILKNFKRVKLKTLFLYEGFSMFFFISAFAGYTFFYTNFSIFLVALLILLRHDINILKDSKTQEPSI